MFNVDLLHPDDQAKEPQMFVDHIDFPVKESLSMKIDYSGKTILLPKSDFFYDFATKIRCDFTLTDGKEETIEFNLLNEAGLILSKVKSAFNPKRTRDAYDIYLAIRQSRDYAAMIGALRNISQSHAPIFFSLHKMHSTENLKILQTNIYEWGQYFRYWRK